MKLVINPKREIFKWGPIDLYLLYASYFLIGIWQEVPRNYQWPWPFLYSVIEKGKFTAILDYADLKKVGSSYFKKYFLNLKNYHQLWSKWQSWLADYQVLEKQYQQINFKRLTDKQLLELYRKFYDFYIKFWLIVHVPEVANWGGEHLLKIALSKIDKKKSDHYLEVLSSPVKYSFFQLAELDLLKLAQIKSQSQKEEGFRKHALKYCWLLNSYGGNRILTVQYFKKELKELLKNSTPQKKINEIKKVIINNRQRKKDLIRKLKLNKKISLVAEQLAQSIWWQDLRKGYMWRLHHLSDPLLKEMARRSGWRFEDILICWPQEVIKIFKGQKVDRRRIFKRKKLMVFGYDYQKNYRLFEYYDQKAENVRKAFIQPKLSQNIKEISGLTVSQAREVVRGQVKLIRNPFKEGKKMKKGDILVASMTSPEFIIVMKKAAAIITDEGGMTCHAAVVSRELKIPCLVKTRIATQVLKDGDKVEIDTQNGLVRKLS